MHMSLPPDACAHGSDVLILAHLCAVTKPEVSPRYFAVQRRLHDAEAGIQGMQGTCKTMIRFAYTWQLAR